MYGLEINQLASLLKESDPNRNDSDSDDDQVYINKYFILFVINYSIFQPKKNPAAHLTPANFVSQTQKTAHTIDDAITTSSKSMFYKTQLKLEKF